MKQKLALGLILALLCGSVYFGYTLTNQATQAQVLTQRAVLVSPFNPVIDVDRPPSTVFLLYPGTITLVKQGPNGPRTVQVYSFPSDGGGPLLLRSFIAQPGTVATFRAMRRGTGTSRFNNPIPAPVDGLSTPSSSSLTRRWW